MDPWLCVLRFWKLAFSVATKQLTPDDVIRQFDEVPRPDLPLGFASAIDAEHYRRIKLETLGIDRLVALQADSIIAVVNAFERGFDTAQRLRTPFIGCLGHRLGLHRVHPR